ncbi:MAG: hypothetical protein DMD53_14045 [Gemmatimonadetes bacterium]|nr:MAG: hypothetical protein DMD53_14045 [Gemmatimonadota bacterium]
MSITQYYVYILTNKNHTVLYTGITNDLQKRTWEHKTGLGSKFTTRYRTVKLVYEANTSRIYPPHAHSETAPPDEKEPQNPLVHQLRKCSSAKRSQAVSADPFLWRIS